MALREGNQDSCENLGLCIWHFVITGADVQDTTTNVHLPLGWGFSKWCPGVRNVIFSNDELLFGRGQSRIKKRLLLVYMIDTFLEIPVYFHPLLK